MKKEHKILIGLGLGYLLYFGAKKSNPYNNASVEFSKRGDDTNILTLKELAKKGFIIKSDDDDYLNIKNTYFSVKGETIYIYNGKTLQIEKGETLLIYGTIYNLNGGRINNEGTIDNSSEIYNKGTINNNNGTINNEGTINIGIKEGTIDNNGTINNYEKINGSRINNYEKINNKGTINISSEIYNKGTIDNYEIINNSWIIYNYGKINNYEKINNKGAININNGTIDNNGTIYNYETIDNYKGGRINNEGTINNYKGTIDNYEGTINNYEKIYNTGTINSKTIVSRLNNTGNIYDKGVINIGNNNIINYGKIYDYTDNLSKKINNKKYGLIFKNTDTGFAPYEIDSNKKYIDLKEFEGLCLKYGLPYDEIIGAHEKKDEIIKNKSLDTDQFAQIIVFLESTLPEDLFSQIKDSLMNLKFLIK